MKKFRLMKKVFFIFLIVGLAVTGCAKTEAAPKVYTMRFSCSLSPGMDSSLGPKEWCEYIEANSGGRIKTQFFDSGSLYKASESLEAVMMGMCEAQESLASDLVAAIPEFELLITPGVTNIPGFYDKIADGEIGDKLMKSLERKGLKGIALVSDGGYGKYGTGYVTKTRFIKVPTDFAGLKICVTFPADVTIVSKYGGVPVSMPGGEKFMALQLGTIDGTSCGFNHFEERKLNEAGAIYYTVCPTKGAMVYVVSVNKDWFDKLPSDLQILLLESGKRIIDVGSRQRAEKSDESDYQYAIDHGVLVHELTPEELAMWEGEVDEVIEAMKAKDPGLKELLEMVEELKRQG